MRCNTNIEMGRRKKGMTVEKKRERERKRSEEFESTPRSDDFQERYLPWQRKESQRRWGYVGEEAHRVFLFRLFDRTYPGLHTKERGSTREILANRAFRVCHAREMQLARPRCFSWKQCAPPRGAPSKRECHMKNVYLQRYYSFSEDYSTLFELLFT